MKKQDLEICVRISTGDPECLECNGYPVEKGCLRYVTQDHITNFYKMFNVPSSLIPPATSFDDIDQAGGAIGGYK